LQEGKTSLRIFVVKATESYLPERKSDTKTLDEEAITCYLLVRPLMEQHFPQEQKLPVEQ